jgi:hypothetical protein
VTTLRAAAELISAAGSIEQLWSIARAIGCAGAAEALDDDTRRALGLDETILDARIAAGAGALRALLLVVADEAPLRDAIQRLAARLAARAPHVLWIVVASQRAREEVAIAAWSGDRQPPRIAALIAQRSRVVDSDAETLRALIAATSDRDLIAHARWVEILGREALTVRFYRDLEAAIERLARSATGRGGNDETRRELAVLNASRLLFLCFLEAKGWLDGDRAFLLHQFEACVAGRGAFHDRVLRPLFFGTLNTPPRRRAPAARSFGRIPFLNGGLFARTHLERGHRGLSLSDDAYGALLYDVFGQYRFTAREESASWSEAAVDPEMLGRAFESLMASRERRRTGAFFTPFHLVERIAKTALLTSLGDSAAAALTGEPLTSAESSALRCRALNVTVLDPACGSGAFLVHVLERLSDLHARLGDSREVSAIRRDVLTRSIFGVDINPTAVWLCQLRLWLSVVIESGEDDPMAVLPLPNLDRNIRVGDALSGSAFRDAATTPTGTADIRRLRERYARATGPRKQAYAAQLDRRERARALSTIDEELAIASARRRDLVLVQRGRDLFGERYRPSADERRAAAELRDHVAALRTQRRRILHGGALPFSFPVHFAEIAARGFDLILGNPPWIRLHRVDPRQRTAFRRAFTVARSAAWESGAAPAGASRGFAGQIDVAAIFVERSVDLLAPGGVLSLLLPVKLWQSLAGGGVRHFLTHSTRIRRIEDHSLAPASFDAAVYPSVIVAERACSVSTVADPIYAVVHHRAGAELSWRMPAESLAFDSTPGAPWLLLPPDVRRAFDRLRRAGVALAQSAIGRPRLGVKCGCNEAFVVDVLEVDDDLAEVQATDGSRFTIERALLRPLLRGERLRRWTTPASYEAIVWTHDALDGPLSVLPPHAARWLARWRRALMQRADARHRARWWSLFRTESARFDLPRVVWCDVGREPRASVLEANDPRVPLNSCYVARCGDECDAYAFATLLNGPLARAWLDALAEPARGGYHRYLGWTLSLLPVPTDWARARRILSPLAERAVRECPPSDVELMEASLDAYGLRRSAVAPLVAWAAG